MIALPNEERGFDLAMPDQTAAMDEGGEAHGAKGLVGQKAKVAPLVAAAKGEGEDFFGEPTVEETELLLVIHVLEVVVDDGDVADALIESVFREFDGELGALTVVENAREFGTFAAKSETKEIADLAEFVAREADTAVGVEFQTEMADGAGREEAGRGCAGRGEEDV